MRFVCVGGRLEAAPNAERSRASRAKPSRAERSRVEPSMKPSTCQKVSRPLPVGRPRPRRYLW